MTWVRELELWQFCLFFFLARENLQGVANPWHEMDWFRWVSCVIFKLIYFPHYFVISNKIIATVSLAFDLWQGEETIPNLINSLQASDWKERQQAIDQFVDLVQLNPDGSGQKFTKVIISHDTTSNEHVMILHVNRLSSGTFWYK